MTASKRGRLYRRFTEFSPAFAWNVFKQLVSAHCLQGCGIPVSHILSAPLFNLNSVFVRQPQRGFAERAQSNEFIACGHVSHVMKHGDANFHAKIDNFWRVDDNCSNQPHVFSWSDTDWRHGRKAITIRIEGIRKLCSAAFLPTECQLDPSALPVKPMPAEIYVVHEVWYAKQLQIFQELNGKVVEWEWRYIPIGFALVKYAECKPDGWLGFPRELHRSPWFTGDFKLCRYLETLVRSRFFVQPDAPPGRPQRPSETFLASDEVGGKRQLDPDEIRDRFERWRSRKIERDRRRRCAAEIGSQPAIGGFDDVFDPSPLVRRNPSAVAADSTTYSSLIASPINFAKSNGKLYESLLELSAYPRPPDLATLPVEPPVPRRPKPISLDSGDYVEIPNSGRPQNRSATPGKDFGGLPSASSGPNVAAWVRTGYPYVEGEPRTLLWPPIVRQAIGRWSIEEAAARRRAIETVRARESSAYRRRKSVRRLASDLATLRRIPFARRRLVAIAEEDENVVVVFRKYQQKTKAPENSAFLQGRHVSEPAPQIRGSQSGASPFGRMDAIGLPGMGTGSEEVFDLQSPPPPEESGDGAAPVEQFASPGQLSADVSKGRSMTELVCHSNGMPRTQRNGQTDEGSWRYARIRLNSSPQPVAPAGLQPDLDDNNNEKNRKNYQKNQNYEDDSQHFSFWKRIFK